MVTTKKLPRMTKAERAVKTAGNPVDQLRADLLEEARKCVTLARRSEYDSASVLRLSQAALNFTTAFVTLNGHL
jgi:hypothetical protein